MSDKRIIDVLRDRKVATEPEKLEDFEGKELILRNFQFLPGTYGEYVLLDVVDEGGQLHMLSTGGMSILRLLKELDPETDLPAPVKFIKVTSGTGRKVWSIV